MGYPLAGTGVPPANTGVPLLGLGYPLARTEVLPWKGPGTRDLGKNLGLEYPKKGPGTRELQKNLGQGYSPVVNRLKTQESHPA